MKRSVVVLVAALIGAFAIMGAAATLGVTSKKVDSFTADQAATTIPSDSTPPSIAAPGAEFLDTDSDGKLDRVRVTFDEPLGAYTGTATDWRLSAGRPVGMGESPTSVQISGSQVLLDWTTLSDIEATAASMTLRLDSNAAVRDTAGNAAAAFSGQTVADKAAPIATAAEYYDASTPANGIIDQIKVTYSEDLASTTATAPWSIANGPTGLVTADLTAVTTSGAIIQLAFAEGSGGNATAVTTVAPNLTVSLNNPTSPSPQVRDLATPANASANLTNRATTDKAAPIPTSLVLANKGGGGSAPGKLEKDDKVTVVFSEPLNTATLCPGKSGSFAIDNINDEVKVLFTDGASPTSDTFDVTTATECTASGLRFGKVTMNRSDFVSAATAFWGNGSSQTDLSWNNTTATLVITLGAKASGTETQSGGTSSAVYDPHNSLADPSGNTVPATFTLATIATTHF